MCLLKCANCGAEPLTGYNNHKENTKRNQLNNHRDKGGIRCKRCKAFAPTIEKWNKGLLTLDIYKGEQQFIRKE